MSSTQALSLSLAVFAGDDSFFCSQDRLILVSPHFQNWMSTKENQSPSFQQLTKKVPRKTLVYLVKSFTKDLSLSLKKLSCVPK